MLFPAEHYDGLRTGAVTVAFRSWKRPTVVAGGTLQSPGGLLAIDEVAPISRDDVTDSDARAAGMGSVADVFAWIDAARLTDTDDRRLYRIRFHRIGDDPRIALARRCGDRLRPNASPSTRGWPAGIAAPTDPGRRRSSR